MTALADHVAPQPFALSAVASAGSPLDRLLTFVNLEPHSFFLLCLTICVVFVLVHLSNPTESSFRAFITELALRRHITKLNGGDGSDLQTLTGGINQSGSGGRPTSSTPLPTPPPSAPIGPGFHFSNRANVSLRTPDHIIRSFLFFTIVIITPLANDHQLRKDAKSKVASAPEGSWYVGALGHWWMGGTLEFPYSRAFAQREVLGKEEGSTSEPPAGVLSMRCLDRTCPEAIPAGCPTPLIKSSPVKSSKINRRRSVARKTLGNASDDESVPRSTTPPPLPKSVSLPLHSARMPPSTNSTRTPGVERVRITPAKPLPKPAGSHSKFREPTSPQRSSAHPASHIAALDQHPSVIEVIKEIRSTQSTLNDLQGQLSSVANTAAIQHQGLQETLQDCRDKKLQDDQVRIESKSRMKVVEDSRQAAELNKRAVEKRLKGVQSQHDLALSRIGQLEAEIQQLQKTMAEDESRIVKSGIETSANDVAMEQKLQTKRTDLKLAQDTADALEKRSTELRTAIEETTAKLAKAKADAEERHRQRTVSMQQRRTSFGSTSRQSLNKPPIHIQVPAPSQSVRGPGPFNFGPAGPIPSRQPPVSLLQRRNIPAAAEPEPLQIPPSPNSSVPSINDLALPAGGNPQRPRSMSLAGNVAVTVETTGAPGFTAISNGYSSRNGSSVGVIGRGAGSEHVSPAPSVYGKRSSLQSQHRAFAPFSDTDSLESLTMGSVSAVHDDATSLSTFATSLLPTSLVKSMDGGENSPSPDGSSSYVPYSALDQAYNSGNARNGTSFRNGSWSQLQSSLGDHPYQQQQQFSPNSTKYSTPDLSMSSPVVSSSSPDSYVSPATRFANRFEVTSRQPQRQNSFGSSSSQPSFEHHQYSTTSGSSGGLETLDEEKAARYRRWFPSFINTSGAQMAVFPAQEKIVSSTSPVKTPASKTKSGLNPDAKAFSLSRGRSSLLTTGSGNLSQARGADSALPNGQSSFAARMYGSLTHGLHAHRHREETEPPVTTESGGEDGGNTTLSNANANNTPTGHFFSSLLAFQPSPAERQALQRGLVDNNSTTMAAAAATSRELLAGTAVSPFTSPLPSAQTSVVELAAQHHPHTAVSAPWDRDVVIAPPAPPATKTSPLEKRSFSSLWLRNKASKSNTSLTEEKEKDKDVTTPPIAAPASVMAAENDPPAFGSRFVRFTRQKTTTSASVESKDS